MKDLIKRNKWAFLLGNMFSIIGGTFILLVQSRLDVNNFITMVLYVFIFVTLLIILFDIALKGGDY